MEVVALFALFRLFIAPSSGLFESKWHTPSWNASSKSLRQEYVDAYKNLIKRCNDVQAVTRAICTVNKPTCCALFAFSDFCVSKCKESSSLFLKVNIYEFVDTLSFSKCMKIVQATGMCESGSPECEILEILRKACIKKFPSLGKSPATSPVTPPSSSISAATSAVTSPLTGPAISQTSSATTSATTSPVTSPTTNLPISPTTSPIISPITSPTTSAVTSPATSPFTSPITSPTTSPATSPFTSPITSPTTSAVTSPVTSPVSSPIKSRPIGVFYCDVMGVTGRVQMPVSKWCDGVVDCSPNGEDERGQNCDGCNAGQFKCLSSDSTCLAAQNICNGIQDCPNNFDEVTSRCTPNT